MSWTKRQIVEAAYAELALAGWVYDLEPEELQYGLMRLDALMATWAANGIQVGYALATNPDDSDLDQDSGLPVIAIEAAYMALACRIAANKGKALAVSTTRVAKQAYDALISTVARSQVQPQQLASGTPHGRGNKCRPLYVSTPDTSPLQTGEGGGLALTGLGA